MMGVVVLSSNYLVQFPINYYGLNEILTYGAFSYPVAFLITDLANRSYGKIIARKIVYFGFFIGKVFGPKFRSKKTIVDNIRNYKSSLKNTEIEKIIKKMWGNYGRILAEYPYVSSFRKKRYFCSDS